MFKIRQKLGRSIPTLCAAAAAAAFFFAVRQAYSAGRDTRMLPGTVSNFELPNFDENSGMKEWELFGDKATYISDEHIDIDNMKLNLFEGKETPVLKAVMTSPNAQVNAPKKTVTSLDKIFVSGDAFDLSGKKWKWNGDKKFIEIFSNVNIRLSSKNIPDIDAVAGLPSDSTSSGKPHSEGESAAGESEKESDQSSITKISSDYASLDHGGKANKFNVKKNVLVKNADMRLECDELEVDSLKSGEDKIGEIRARGNVRMSTDLRKASSEALTILPSKNQAVLSGNPEIEDISSKSRISGGRIILNRSEKSIISLPSPDGKIRPKTLLFNAQGGKPQEISIQADDIKMRTENKKSFFDFKGNVTVSSEDFKARCDAMSATASPGADGKNQIEKIEGSGNVLVATPSGEAKAKNLEIIPSKSEILLHDNVVLTDAKRGFNLRGKTLIFVSGRDEGVALSDGKNKDSYVITTIAETPSVERSGGPNAGKAMPTVIKSRLLSFSRDGSGIANLHFQKDVSIKSDDIDASCQKMDVVAKSQKGKTDIYKIVASKDVVVSQKGNTATAQLANIYPRVNEDKPGGSSGAEKKIHRFVELLTDEKSPDIRPAIILPALGNIGLNDEYYAEKTKPEPTVITSDKQWLTSSLDSDKYYFKGSVKVAGTDMSASCENIEVTIKPPARGSKREITHIAMTDNVKLSQGLKDAACGRADIYAKEEMVVLSNSPVVRNREDNTRATGYRIIYNRGKQSATIEAENPGQTQQEQSETQARPTVTLPPIGSFERK